MDCDDKSFCVHLNKNEGKQEQSGMHPNPYLTIQNRGIN